MAKRVLILLHILLMFIILIAISTNVYAFEFKDFSINSLSGGGAEITLKAKVGPSESAGVEVTATCDKEFSVDKRWYGVLREGETQEMKLKIIGGPFPCEEVTASCEITAKDTLSQEILDRHTISFVNKCSVCGLSFAWCKKGEFFCEDGRLTTCNEFCDDTKIIKNCELGCEINPETYDWGVCRRHLTK